MISKRVRSPVTSQPGSMVAASGLVYALVPACALVALLIVAALPL